MRLEKSQFVIPSYKTGDKFGCRFDSFKELVKYCPSPETTNNQKIVKGVASRRHAKLMTEGRGKRLKRPSLKVSDMGNVIEDDLVSKDVSQKDDTSRERALKVVEEDFVPNADSVDDGEKLREPMACSTCKQSNDLALHSCSRVGCDGVVHHICSIENGCEELGAYYCSKECLTPKVPKQPHEKK